MPAYRTLEVGEKIIPGDEAFIFINGIYSLKRAWSVLSQRDIDSIGNVDIGVVDAETVPIRRRICDESHEALIEQTIKTLIWARLIAKKKSGYSELTSQLQKILADNHFSVLMTATRLADLWQREHKPNVYDLLKLRRYADENSKWKLLRYDLEVESGLCGHPKTEMLWTKTFDEAVNRTDDSPKRLIAVIESYRKLAELVK